MGGYAEHTVTAGPNKVDVTLSKKPNVAANLLVSITGKHLSGSNIVSLSTQNGKTLLDGIFVGKKPVTARDKIGRIYVLYEDTSSTHLKRFDVEGNEDTGFGTALTTALPPGVTISHIDNIAIDIDDNYIFCLKRIPSIASRRKKIIRLNLLAVLHSRLCRHQCRVPVPLQYMMMYCLLCMIRLCLPVSLNLNMRPVIPVLSV